MGIVLLRLNKDEEELVKSYATLTGKTLSELFKTTLTEQIEEQLDYKVGIAALKRYEENPVSHSINDVITELENEL